jgi:ATP-dependent RNA helicase RhlE
LTSFSDLGLDAPILKTLRAEGYESPTPIQTQAIPQVLSGQDLLGIAQTGTGKTAAFALPILQRLAMHRAPAPRRGCRALVLSPTRELASQIEASFRVYGRQMNLTSTVVFGGVGAGPQIRAMARGVDILVATPGRLLDHIGQGNIQLGNVEVFVLDEADHMLDLGFIQPIRRIVSGLPAVRQNLFFSATMPREIRKLAAELLVDPVEVAVVPHTTTVERVEQQVILVEGRQKAALLAELMVDKAVDRALVFTRTKRGADRVTRHLAEAGIGATAIHGNKSQGQREHALAGFRAGRTRVLVATDIAARGIDVEAVSHVINFDLPNVPESYVHRIGRTARAGAGGIAISFCDAEERPYLRSIEALIRQQLPLQDRRSEAGARPAANAAAAGKTTSHPGARQRKGQDHRRAGSSQPVGRGDLSGIAFLKAPRPKTGNGGRAAPNTKGPRASIGGASGSR